MMTKPLFLVLSLIHVDSRLCNHTSFFPAIMVLGGWVKRSPAQVEGRTLCHQVRELHA